MFDGLVKVTINGNGTFSATHYATDSSSSDFSFTGTYSSNGTSFNADSAGVFSTSISNHTGTYSASLKESLLVSGSYTGFWALAKELK